MDGASNKDNALSCRGGLSNFQGIKQEKTKISFSSS
jgi:hypothetical protein